MLVRANVVNIVEKQGKVCGVRVRKGTETHDIFAPMIISSAGIIIIIITIIIIIIISLLYIIIRFNTKHFL